MEDSENYSNKGVQRIIKHHEADTVGPRSVENSLLSFLLFFLIHPSAEKLPPAVRAAAAHRHNSDPAGAEEDKLHPRGNSTNNFQNSEAFSESFCRFKTRGARC